ncbi:hypothetical protein ACFONJ_10595 [Chryseobacterium tructae]|uniref:Uncharacterized protein n=1 Tax=Chryseobacterium tructae TaxID=1037380 RepID=A0ABV7XX38_9FLAO
MSETTNNPQKKITGNHKNYSSLIRLYAQKKKPMKENFIDLFTF